MKCERDGYTYVTSWWKQKKLWALMKLPDEPGYMTLPDLLAHAEFISIWNDTSTIVSMDGVLDLRRVVVIEGGRRLNRCNLRGYVSGCTGSECRMAL